MKNSVAQQDQVRTESAVPGGFLALAERRHSVRAYSGKAVARDKIERCLEAARLAPSACNSQPWTWVVVDQPGLRAELASAAGGGLLPLNHFVHQAPVLMVLVAEKASASARFGAAVKRKSFVLMDVAIAAEHFCLQAAEEGLGTCMLGWFDERRVRFLLRIPEGSRPVLLLTLGYSAETIVRTRRRKPLAEMHAWNRYPGVLSPGARPISGWRSWAGFLSWLAITFAAAGVGGLASVQAGAFYVRLEHPAWAPPGWLFGPVWGVLYPLMGISAWRVWRRLGRFSLRGPLGIYLVQLVLNGLWTWLFFAWRLGGLAVAEILILSVLIAWMIRAFRTVDRWAARMLWPYLGWVLFAAGLAWTLWRMNPGML